MCLLHKIVDVTERLLRTAQRKGCLGAACGP